MGEIIIPPLLILLQMDSDASALQSKKLKALPSDPNVTPLCPSPGPIEDYGYVRKSQTLHLNSCEHYV